MGQQGKVSICFQGDCGKDQNLCSLPLLYSLKVCKINASFLPLPQRDYLWISLLEKVLTVQDLILSSSSTQVWTEPQSSKSAERRFDMYSLTWNCKALAIKNSLTMPPFGNLLIQSKTKGAAVFLSTVKNTMFAYVSIPARRIYFNAY